MKNSQNFSLEAKASTGAAWAFGACGLACCHRSGIFVSGHPRSCVIRLWMLDGKCKVITLLESTRPLRRWLRTYFPFPKVGYGGSLMSPETNMFPEK